MRVGVGQRVRRRERHNGRAGGRRTTAAAAQVLLLARVHHVHLRGRGAAAGASHGRRRVGPRGARRLGQAGFPRLLIVNRS